MKLTETQINLDLFKFGYLIWNLKNTEMYTIQLRFFFISDTIKYYALRDKLYYGNK